MSNDQLNLYNGVDNTFKEIKNNCKKGKTLDIGYMARPNPYLRNVYGVDIKIKNKPSNYVEVKKMKNKIPYQKNTFDNVVAGEVIEHIENTEQFMNEINRVLKKGGRLIITTPNPSAIAEIIGQIIQYIKGYNLQAGIKGDHVNQFLPSNLIALANIHRFKVLKITGTYIQIPFTTIQINTKIIPLTFCTLYILQKK